MIMIYNGKEDEGSEGEVHNQAGGGQKGYLLKSEILSRTTTVFKDPFSGRWRLWGSTFPEGSSDGYKGGV